MSSAQLGLLDRLERIIGFIDGIDDPNDLQPGDWLDVVRGRVAEPISSYRPAAALDEEGQTPSHGTEGQGHTSPWHSVVASASSLELASEAVLDQHWYRRCQKPFHVQSLWFCLQHSVQVPHSYFRNE